MSTSHPQNVLEFIRDLHGESPFEVAQALAVWKLHVDDGHAVPHFLPAAVAELADRPEAGGFSEKRRAVLHALHRTLDDRRADPGAWLYPTAAALVGGIRVENRVENNETIATGAAVVPVRVEFYATDAPGEGNTADTTHRVRWIWPSGWDDASIEVRRTLQRRLGLILRWVASFADRPWQTGVWVVYPAALHPYVNLRDPIPSPGSTKADRSSISSLELAVAVGVYACLQGQNTASTEVEPAFWATGALPLNIEPPSVPHNGPSVGAVGHLLLKSWAVAKHINLNGLGDAAPLLVPARMPDESPGERQVDQEFRTRVDEWQGTEGALWTRARSVAVETLADAVAACKLPLPVCAPHWVAYRAWAYQTSLALIEEAVSIGDLDAAKLYVERPGHDQVLRRFVFGDHNQPLLLVEGASGTGKTWWSAFNARALLNGNTTTGNPVEAAQNETLVLYSTVLSTRTRDHLLVGGTPLGVADVAQVAEHLAGVLRSHPNGRIVWFVDALDRREHSVADFDALCGLFEHPALIAYRGRMRVVVTGRRQTIHYVLNRLLTDPSDAGDPHRHIWRLETESAEILGNREMTARSQRALRIGRFDQDPVHQPGGVPTADPEPDLSFTALRAFANYTAMLPDPPRPEALAPDMLAALEHPVLLRTYFERLRGAPAVSHEEPRNQTAAFRSTACKLLDSLLTDRLVQAIPQAEHDRAIPQARALLRRLIGHELTLGRSLDLYVMPDCISTWSLEEPTLVGVTRNRCESLLGWIEATGLAYVETDATGKRELNFVRDIWRSFLGADLWQTGAQAEPSRLAAAIDDAMQRDPDANSTAGTIGLVLNELLHLDVPVWIRTVARLARAHRADSVANLLGRLENVGDDALGALVSEETTALRELAVDVADVVSELHHLGHHRRSIRLGRQTIRLLRTIVGLGADTCFDRLQALAASDPQVIDALATTYAVLGAAHSERHELKAAIEAHERCVAIREAITGLRLGPVELTIGENGSAFHVGTYEQTREVRNTVARNPNETESLAYACFTLSAVNEWAGRWNDRLAAISRAVLLLETLATRVPLNTTEFVRHAIELNRRSVRNLAIGYKELGCALTCLVRSREAETVLTRAILLLEGLVNLGPRDKADRVYRVIARERSAVVDLADALGTYGLALRLRHAWNEAETVQTREVLLLEALTNLGPSDDLETLCNAVARDRDVVRRLANAYQGLGALLRGADRRHEALAAFARAVAMFEALANLRPAANIDCIRKAIETHRRACLDLAIGHCSLGTALSEASDSIEAVQVLTRAVVLLEALANIGPSSDQLSIRRAIDSDRFASRNLAVAQLARGRALSVTAGPQEAAPLLARAVLLLEILADHGLSDDADRVRVAIKADRLSTGDLAVGYFQLGLALHQANRSNEAATLLARAVFLFEALDDIVFFGDRLPVGEGITHDRPINHNLLECVAVLRAALKKDNRPLESIAWHEREIAIRSVNAGVNEDMDGGSLRDAVRRDKVAVRDLGFTLAQLRQTLNQTRETSEALPWHKREVAVKQAVAGLPEHFDANDVRTAIDTDEAAVRSLAPQLKSLGYALRNTGRSQEAVSMLQRAELVWLGLAGVTVPADAVEDTARYPAFLEALQCGVNKWEALAGVNDATDAVGLIEAVQRDKFAVRELGFAIARVRLTMSPDKKPKIAIQMHEREAAVKRAVAGLPEDFDAGHVRSAVVADEAAVRELATGLSTLANALRKFRRSQDAVKTLQQAERVWLGITGLPVAYDRNHLNIAVQNQPADVRSMAATLIDLGSALSTSSRFQEARVVFQRAAGLWEALAGVSEDTHAISLRDAVRRDMAAVHELGLALARLLETFSFDGERKDALPWRTREVAVKQALAGLPEQFDADHVRAAIGNDETAVRSVAATLVSLGVALKGAQRRGEAVEVLMRAECVWMGLVGLTDPTDPGQLREAFRREAAAVRELAKVYGNLRQALKEDKRPLDSIVWHEREIAIGGVLAGLPDEFDRDHLDLAVQNHPAEIRSIAAAHFSLGIILKDAKQYQDAGVALQRAVVAWEALADVDEQADAGSLRDAVQRDKLAVNQLAFALAHLRETLNRNKETGEALPWHKREVAVRQAVAGLPEHFDTRDVRAAIDADEASVRSLAPQLSALGAALKDARHYPQSVEVLQRAECAWMGLAGLTDSTDSTQLREAFQREGHAVRELAKVHVILRQALKEDKRPLDAIVWHEREIAIRRVLAGLPEAFARDHLDLAVQNHPVEIRSIAAALFSLGIILKDAKQYQHAGVALQRAVGAWEALAGVDEQADAGSLRDAVQRDKLAVNQLAFALAHLRETLNRNKETGEALPWHKREVAVRQAVAGLPEHFDTRDVRAAIDADEASVRSLAPQLSALGAALKDARQYPQCVEALLRAECAWMGLAGLTDPTDPGQLREAFQREAGMLYELAKVYGNLRQALRADRRLLDSIVWHDREAAVRKVVAGLDTTFDMDDLSQAIPRAAAAIRNLAHTLTNHGKSLIDAKQGAEARSVLEDALTVWEGLAGLQEPANYTQLGGVLSRDEDCVRQLASVCVALGEACTLTDEVNDALDAFDMATYFAVALTEHVRSAGRTNTTADSALLDAARNGSSSNRQRADAPSHGLDTVPHEYSDRLATILKQLTFSDGPYQHGDLVRQAEPKWLPVLLACTASRNGLDVVWFTNLAGSVSLSANQKRRILDSLPSLTDQQVKELRAVLHNEAQQFDELSRADPGQLDEARRLQLQRCHEWLALVVKLAHENGVPIPW